jgi:HEAT repeat protein
VLIEPLQRVLLLLPLLISDLMDPSNLSGQTIVANLQDSKEHARIAALADLAKPEASSFLSSGDVLRAVAGRLEDSNPEIRTLAAALLGQIGAPAISPLALALDEKQPPVVRIMAAAGLARLGPGAAPTVPELVKCLESTDERLRSQASLALARIGAPAVPSLRVHLTSSNPDVVAAAADTLGLIGPEAREAVEDMQRQARESPPKSRLKLQTALIKITQDTSSLLPLFLTLLTQTEPEARQDALESLGELGQMAKDSSPHVLQCLSDPSAQVRAAAVTTLARTGAEAPQVLSPLKQMLSDPDGEVRTQTLLALASLGPAASAALPEVRAMQQSTETKTAAIAKATASLIEEGAKGGPRE